MSVCPCVGVVCADIPVESFALLAQSGDPRDQLLEELKRFVWPRFSPGCVALYFFCFVVNCFVYAV